MLGKLPPTLDEFIRQLEEASKERDARMEEEHKKWAEEHPQQASCNHGITFDKEAAQALIDDAAEIRNERLAMMDPDEAADEAIVNFIMGSDATEEIRARWPRLCGECPLGCGYNGIYYASMDHYRYGDW